MRHERVGGAGREAIAKLGEVFVQTTARKADTDPWHSSSTGSTALLSGMNPASANRNASARIAVCSFVQGRQHFQ